MLSIRNLSKSYGDVQALRDVSLEVPPGMFGLLGPNGAGKSSLMRTIATLQDPDSGTVTFDGIDVATDKDRIRRTLGYLPQDFGVYPKVSALERAARSARCAAGCARRRLRRDRRLDLLQHERGERVSAVGRRAGPAGALREGISQVQGSAAAAHHRCLCGRRHLSC